MCCTNDTREMSLSSAVKPDENFDLNKKENDVVEQANNVSATSVETGNNITAGSSNLHRRKTRRGKTRKRTKSGSKPYAKTQWKFQRAPGGPRQRKRSVMLGEIRQSSDKPPLVPYNTNKFLMEDHMPHQHANATPSGRTRDSSFSIDSEENYFYSLPEDEEEFLTKEFASVYEDARCERLEAMAKPQLIQEYLQLEANFEQLSRKYSLKFGKLEVTQRHAAKEERRMDVRMRELMAENLELKRQLEHISRLGIKMPVAMPSPRNMQTSSDSSDSESDSSSSSSSSTDEMEDGDIDQNDVSMNGVTQNGFEEAASPQSSSNQITSSPPTPLIKLQTDEF